MERTRSDLAGAIKASVFHILEKAHIVGIPFSGGLDSSIIAFLAKNYVFSNKNEQYITLFAAGVEGCYDFGAAKSAAEKIGLPLIAVEMNEYDIENAVTRVAKVIGSENPVHVSIALPLFFVCKHAKHGSLILTGQGADELFAGYSRYLDVPLEKLNETLERDLNALLDEGIKRDVAIAEAFKLNIAFPFLDKNVIKIAKDAPANEKIATVEGKKVRKYMLRQAAIALGLDESIAMREKKAAQYGSGAMDALKKLAKGRGESVGDYIKGLIEQANK